MLQQDSFRTGTSLSPICECGTEESVQHFLLQCQNYTTIRSKLFNNTEDCLGEKSISDVTGCFLLSPSLQDNITKSDNNKNNKSDMFFIKEALFEYIAKSKRQM